MAANRKKQAAHTVGTRGEELAADWYRQAGYQIVERNWRCFEGEIDIVARKGRSIAICEVKARTSSRHMDPALAVGPSKQAKVRTAAFRWLDQNHAQGRVRFDVALVVNEHVHMIEGAF